MTEPARRPLTRLFGKQPRWPNPEESVGDFLRLIDGRKSCWKAKGPARTAFETLAVDIRSHLDQCLDSIPGSDWVTWSIYMIGKTPQGAAPVVMFFCEKPQSRRRVQEVIGKSGILGKYPGVKSGNAAFPPDLDQLEPLASEHLDLVEATGSSLHLAVRVLNNKVFVTSHHGNSTSTQISSLGGFVKHNGNVYGFTAGHPHYQTNSPLPLKEAQRIHDEWEIDSDSDTELDIYDDDFMEAMSRASNTPLDARSETSSYSDHGSLDTHSTESLQFPDVSNLTEDRMFDPFTPTSVANCGIIRTWASEDAVPATIDHMFARNESTFLASDVTEGHAVVLSADLDYALIKFKDSTFPDACAFAGDSSTASPLRPTHVVSTGPRDTKIITYTASAGFMTGTLDGTPSYTRLPNSKTFQKVYTVRFTGSLAKGDCGSWVIDAETRGLYGHIVAGSKHTGTAYIVPAHNVFEDARDRLGWDLLLDCESESIFPNGSTSVKAGLREDSDNDSVFLPTRRARRFMTSPRHSLQRRSKNAISDSSSRVHKPSHNHRPPQGNLASKGKKRTVTNANLLDKSFPCAFHHYGCSAKFASKNEWKRHVSSQHLQLGYFRCDLEPCSLLASEKSNRGHNDFSRKDLFTQHCRRMHAPWSGTRQSVKGVSKKEEANFEKQLEGIRHRCWINRRKAPAKSRCGFCGRIFVDGKDSKAWDERMEHVGRHFERDGYSAREEAIDDYLKEWAINEGLVVPGKKEGEWWLAGLAPKEVSRSRKKSVDEDEDEDEDEDGDEDGDEEAEEE